MKQKVKIDDPYITIDQAAELVHRDHVTKKKYDNVPNLKTYKDTFTGIANQMGKINFMHHLKRIYGSSLCFLCDPQVMDIE